MCDQPCHCPVCLWGMCSALLLSEPHEGESGSCIPYFGQRLQFFNSWDEKKKGVYRTLEGQEVMQMAQTAGLVMGFVTGGWVGGESHSLQSVATPPVRNRAFAAIKLINYIGRRKPERTSLRLSSLGFLRNQVEKGNAPLQRSSLTLQRFNCDGAEQ